MAAHVVQLYVYDLSNGLARSMSAALLGVQIEAVYHTSIVLQDVEYVYDGGIQSVRPGQTHLGRPMQVIRLGQTSLPMDVIQEYIDSLRSIYTFEAYDLWRHNCNDFSNTLAVFLLGHGIPKHIKNLPQTVLDSPFGRMLQPSIDEMMLNRRNKKAGILGIAGDEAAQFVNVPQTRQQITASVKLPKSEDELGSLLSLAGNSCAIIFFTSKTCGPCKPLYPVFDELASEMAHKATFIKVDVSESIIGMKYDVRATPTFITFLKGEQENRWTGSDPRVLRGNVKMLVEMAWPPHQHQSLRLPTLGGASTKPVLYSKVPPLDKLMSKMGESAKNPAVEGVRRFVAAKSSAGATEATLPDLDAFSWFLRDSVYKLPVDIIFTVVDLLRIAMADPRFSGYYAEEKGHKTISPLFEFVNKLQDCPYSLRLVALQTACNLFSSPLYIEHILTCKTLTEPIIQLITTSLLDAKHHNVRVVAASLSFNIATANAKLRTDEHREALPEEDQVELAASLIEAINVEEESAEAFKGFLLALGYLVFCAPKDGELVDLLKITDAEGVVLGKGKLFPKEALVVEVGKELLGRGF